MNEEKNSKPIQGMGRLGFKNCGTIKKRRAEK
jgi:hypothetical protein